MDPPLNCGQRLVLSPSDSHHLVRVLRLLPGGALVVSDGSGTDYPAILLSSEKRGREVQAMVELGAGAPNEADAVRSLHLGVVLGSFDRFERLLEQVAELGARSVVPLISERCQSREVSAAKFERWQRIAVEGSQLAGRGRPLQVLSVGPLEAYLAEGPGVLLHQSGAPLEGALQVVQRVAVGPEGGFTDAEVARALDCGWVCCSLGSRNLRVETAALVAAALCLT